MPKFKMGTTYGDSRPQGCFKYGCSEDTEAGCYFYNAGEGDGNVSGTPVCTRNKLENGTIDGQGCGLFASQGYKVITSDTSCQAAATCMNIPMNVPFHILKNETE